MGNSFRLTEQQRKALEQRGISVALSAGAGCGKTRVLVERYLRELMEPTDKGAKQTDYVRKLSRLVAITFTERAAREMRDRIRSAVLERINECPEQEVAAWLQLMRQLDNARISTIHSFCAQLLRAHAVEQGLDPDFRVLDEAQSTLLLTEVIEDWLAEKLAENDARVSELAYVFGYKQLTDILQTLVQLRDRIDFGSWSNVSDRELLDQWCSKLKNTAWRKLIDALWLPGKVFHQMEQVLKKGPPPDAELRKNWDSLQELQHLYDLEKTDTELLDKLSEATKTNIRSEKKWGSAQLQSQFRSVAGKLRNVLRQQLKPLVILYKTPETGAQAAKLTSACLWAAGEILSRYEQQKKELAALDFQDLLQLAGKLVRDDSVIADQISQSIDVILVDEFQDTDPLQTELIRQLCKDRLTSGKLFFVGDFKQSIYRFRGADPEVFRQLRKEIPEEGQLPLSVNFRSQPAILHFVNFLFSNCFGDDYEELKPHRQAARSGPCVELLWDTVEEKRAEVCRKREAELIARRIRQMLDAGEELVVENERLRPVRPGDIAILFRTLSHVQYYEQQLQRYSIPFYVVGSFAFYAQQEIYDIANLLKVLLNPADEVALLGVLRSPFFAITDETLFWLSEGGNSFSDAFWSRNWSEQIDHQQRQCLTFAWNTLSELRRLKDYLPVATLLQEAVARTGYDAALLAEFLGERKVANLLKLIDQARQFDQSGGYGLHDFVTELVQFIATQPREPLAATYPESADVVRLMTIHQAKGLEFPVVFLADVARGLGQSRSRAGYCRQFGPVVKQETSLAWRFYELEEKRADLEESLRLFYVATTRAADHLVLSAVLWENNTTTERPWWDLLSEKFDLETGEPKEITNSEQVKLRVIRANDTELLSPAYEEEMVRRKNLAHLADRIAAATEAASETPSEVGELVRPVPPNRGAIWQLSFSSLEDKAGQLVETPEPLQPTAEDSLFTPQELLLEAQTFGLLVHETLCRIDFRNPPKQPENFVSQLAQRYEVKADDINAAVCLVRRFLQTDRARQIATAAEVHKEIKFMLRWPPNPSSDQQTDSPHPTRVIEGVIDCLYKTKTGEWIVLDYKTNRRAADHLQELVDKYRLQMFLYGAAVESILKVSPKQLVLYFLVPGIDHAIEWNDEARQQLYSELDRLIEAATT